MSLNVPGVAWGSVCRCRRGGVVPHRHGKAEDGTEWIAVLRPKYIAPWLAVAA